MQPCSKELQGLLNQQQQQQSQMSLQDLQNDCQQMTSQFDPTSSHDDFLEQMLFGLQSTCSALQSLPWEDNNFDEQSTAFLASKLRQHQISTAGNGGVQSEAAKSLLVQQQLLLSRGLSGGLRSPTGTSGDFLRSLANGDSFDRSQNDIVDASSFKSPVGDNSVQALFNGFTGSLTSNQAQQFHNPQSSNFGAPAMNQTPASGSTGSGAPSQPRQRVRARRGQATDPHSIAERLRRERIAERMKALQELVPNANKTDKASMLDEIIDYVKFLQLQVKVLSMSRLGGAGAVAPLVADISSEGGADCAPRRGTQAAASSSNGDNTMTVTEHQVAKLLEEDMGSAMQYLQGKGLCLMPISLATAISTATCHPSRSNNHNHHAVVNNNPLLQSNGEGGPTSPSLSVLTVQSATVGTNGREEVSVKDSTSVSKP